MTKILALAVALALAGFAGCISPSKDGVQAASTGAPIAGSAMVPAPTSAKWQGHIMDSNLDTPSHVEPSEQALFPIQQEGFLYDIKELPQVMQVSLDWKGDGQLMIMLHSHKEHGTNVYDEHVTKMSSQHPQCLQVPVGDLSTGEWQIMVHSDGARMLDYTLTVTTVGGAGAVVKDKMHGHDLQDGQFEVKDKAIEPCAPLSG